MGSLGPRLASAGQRLWFSAELYGKRELANHAAAGAYSFLLSATPAFLVLLVVSSLVLRGSSAAADALKGFLGGILGADTLESIAGAYLSKPLTGFAAVFGAVNLVWAARLFVVSIQRGVRAIWADSGAPRPVRENLLTFALEFVILFGVLALLAASQAARIILSAIRDQAARGALLGAFRTASAFLPHLALAVFAFSTYRAVPPARPRLSHCCMGAVLCVSSYAGFLAIVGTLRNAARYDLLYGVMGGLILGLINVYMFFSLYFFFAAFVYVLGSFDALLLGRYLHRSRKKTRTPKARISEDSLTARLPFRLLQRYGKEYEAGRLIFREGEDGKDVFLLSEGEVGILQADSAGGAPLRVSTIRPGEFFGEMAYLLGERRTATARAETPAAVLALPASVFDQFLKVDSRAARRLIKLLSARLAETSRIAADAQARDALSLEEADGSDPEPTGDAKPGETL